ncbi:putative GTP-binding protein [Encephalitozoon hellem]|nr:putative GTP-binding protein [Encephalitozoon hellem]
MVDGRKVLFARSSKSNNLSMGIVGLPNVGKSTLFNFLTRNNVPAENYPFCTIDPSEGRVEIQDERVEMLAEKYMPHNVVRAYLSVTDIAGLVKGASTGVGLGNHFLDNIRNVDGIFHVVRCFEDPEVAHFEDGVDPIRDIEIVNEELRLKDYETLVRHEEKMLKDLRSKPSDKKLKDQAALVKRLVEILKKDWVNKHEFNEEEIAYISTLNLLTVKNVVYLANISEKDYEMRRANKHLRAVLKYSSDVIVFSAAYESSHDSRVFLDKLVKKGYESLDLINFFTVGKDEVRSWTIRRGISAPSAGAVIHSDFKKYFIMAEVMSFEDLKAYGSETEVKKAGKYHQRGKTYVVNDGDIILFKVNPPKSVGKKK